MFLFIGSLFLIGTIFLQSKLGAGALDERSFKPWLCTYETVCRGRLTLLTEAPHPQLKVEVTHKVTPERVSSVSPAPRPQQGR